MPKARVVSSSGSQRRMRPASNPEAREQQLIAYATDLAEKQLREGTASSQVICHYLKLGSTRERKEIERLEEENKLLRAKTESLRNAEDSKAAYEEVLKAFKSYSGQGDDEDDEDESDDY